MSLTETYAVPLHYLVRISDEVDWVETKKLIKSLLQEGTDINARDRYGRTPLYGVCSRGRNEACIRFLLENGANANVKNE